MKTASVSVRYAAYQGYLVPRSHPDGPLSRPFTGPDRLYKTPIFFPLNLLYLWSIIACRIDPEEAV